MEFESSRCVVLNASYEPLSVITAKRALLLILEGKAIVVEEHPHLVVRSVRQSFKVPVMVALKEFVKSRKIFQTKASLTQKNLFMRDNHTCQYCDRHKSALRPREFLTRDHVIPEFLGGKTSWDNLVTACSTCNNKKANYRLEDTTMRLLKLPVAPTIFELWMKHNQRRYQMSHPLVQVA
jgi:5-methylcytosine-specific restriction endonuclease McrA